MLHNITRTMSDSLQHEVQDSLGAYTSLWKARSRTCSRRSAASQATCRTCAPLWAPATAPHCSQGQFGRLVAQNLPENAIFLVTDPKGGAVASLGNKTDLNLSTEVLAASALAPEQADGFFAQKNEALSHLRNPGLCAVVVAGQGTT